MKRLLFVLAACGHGDPTPAPQPVAPAVEHVDLWTLCTKPDDTIVARSPTGSYVEGACAKRASYTFTRDGSFVHLDALLDGKPSTVAKLDGVVSVGLAPPIVAAPEPADLKITVGGAPRAVIDGERLEVGGPTKHHKEGIPLASLLEEAHVDVPPHGHIVASNATEHESIDAAWLTDPAHKILLRHNNAGTIRFDHTGPGVDRHLRGITSIDITSN